MDIEIPNMPEFPDFGTALRFYREHIADRLRQLVPGGRLPDIQLTAKDVVTCMRDADFSISQAAYSDIEQAQYLPKVPKLFLAKVVPCLAIEQGSDEYDNLMDHLMRDVLKQKLGDDQARAYWDDIRAARLQRKQAAKVT